MFGIYRFLGDSSMLVICSRYCGVEEILIADLYGLLLLIGHIDCRILKVLGIPVDYSIVVPLGLKLSDRVKNNRIYKET